MPRTFESLTDAMRLIDDWTANDAEQPSDEQIRVAARALVRHVGGYGQPFDTVELDAEAEGIATTATFDLYAALEAAPRMPLAFSTGDITCPECLARIEAMPRAGEVFGDNGIGNDDARLYPLLFDGYPAVAESGLVDANGDRCGSLQDHRRDGHVWALNHAMETRQPLCTFALRGQ